MRLICLLRCEVAPVENLREGLLELMMAAFTRTGEVSDTKEGYKFIGVLENDKLFLKCLSTTNGC